MTSNLIFHKTYVLFHLFLFVFIFNSMGRKYDRLQKLQNFTKCETFCKSITCEKVKNCSVGFIIPNASYCNCCNLCVMFLNENEDCDVITQDSLRKIAVSRCKKGLKCENGKCVLEDSIKSSLCWKQRNLRQKMKGKEDFSEKLWVPNCDNQGAYEAKQEKNRKSICVDENGNKLFGNGKDSCECSRYMNKRSNQLEFNIRPEEHCSASGNFEPIQCINNLCYCADEETGQIKSQLTRRDNLNKLLCYNDHEHIKSYLKPCEEELQRYRRLVYDLYLKGIHLMSIQHVNCDPDGSFSPVQYIDDRYVCTDDQGNGIDSYYINLDESRSSNISMTCTCARDKISYQVKFWCKNNGNYQYIQCFKDLMHKNDPCYCVDDDGDFISRPLLKENAQNICFEIYEKLKIEPKINEKRTTTSETTTRETTQTDDDYDY